MGKKPSKPHGAINYKVAKKSKDHRSVKRTGKPSLLEHENAMGAHNGRSKQSEAVAIGYLVKEEIKEK